MSGFKSQLGPAGKGSVQPDQHKAPCKTVRQKSRVTVTGVSVNSTVCVSVYSPRGNRPGRPSADEAARCEGTAVLAVKDSGGVSAVPRE